MISVIIPTYNRARSLQRAAQSVLEQTFRDIELLIVDDGSNDDTAQVVEALSDSRVRYLRQKENRGACAARNAGIRAARGEYIAFQDSDDIWHPEKLAAQLEQLLRTDADVVFCAFMRHEGEEEDCLPVGLSDGKCLTYEEMLEHNYVSTQTMMGKRACFQTEMFDEAYPRLQDWELGLRLAGLSAASGSASTQDRWLTSMCRRTASPKTRVRECWRLKASLSSIVRA